MRWFSDEILAMFRGEELATVTMMDPTTAQSGLYETKTSEKKETFATGMVRDSQEGKPRFDLLSPECIPYQSQMLTRWAQLMARGAENYGERNWEKARTTEEKRRARASAYRHFMQWFHGEDDEDHAAAIFFNISEIEMIRYWEMADG